MPRWFHRNYLYIIGTATGIIFAGGLPAWHLTSVALAVLIGFLICFRSWREMVILSIAILFGLLSVWYDSAQHLTQVRNEYFPELTVRIQDAGAYGESFHADDLKPYIIMAEAVDRKDLGTFQLYFPRNMQNPGVGDGELWRVEGCFYRRAPATAVWVADSEGSWIRADEDFSGSYNKYLTLHHITGRLVVNSIEPLETEAPSRMLEFRRKMAERLDQGLSDAEDRALLGAVVLGLRSRLSSGTRREFARIGVAHLFSVSGLHVGVLAVLFLLILRPLPRVWHWLLISTLVFYVLLTGGNAPAIRAFAMILVLEFLKSRLLYTKSLELLSLIGTFLLICNPHYLLDAGFQYSFVVTALLIAASAPVRDIVRGTAGVQSFWGDIPRWKYHLWFWRGRFAGAVVYAAVAALGSGALVLYHQNIFFGWSILVNLLILPILTPLFLLAIGKCMLPWGAEVINAPLEVLLGYLKAVVELAGDFVSTNTIAQPHWLLAAILLAALMGLLVMYRYRWGVIACGAILLAGLALLASGSCSYSSKNFTVIAAGGDLTHPVAAAVMPQKHLMYMLNAGYSGSRVITDIAKSCGVSRIGGIDYAYLVTDCSDGTPYLLMNFAVERIRVTDDQIRSRSFRDDIRPLVPERGAQASVLSAPGYHGCQINELPDGSWELDCNSAGRYQIPRSAYLQFYMIPSE